MITIPNPAAMEDSDEQHLTSLFKKQFDYTPPTITTTITFQHYNSKWNDNLEVDENTKINDRDGVKVIIHVAASTSFSAIKVSTPLSTNAEVDLSDDGSSTSGHEDSSSVCKFMHGCMLSHINIIGGQGKTIL